MSKLARAHGVQLITVVHRVSDLSGQADSGTATQSRAQGLLADAETRVLYAQTPGEREALRDLLDLTDVEAQLVTQLPPHRALWQIGRHRAVVDHVLSVLERDRLVDTDQHMRPASTPGLVAPRPQARSTAEPADLPQPPESRREVSLQPDTQDVGGPRLAPHPATGGRRSA